MCPKSVHVLIQKYNNHEFLTVSLLTCNFEHGLCGWKQDKKDNFDWIIHQGHTTSSLTGPQYDHTLNNILGQFIDVMCFRMNVCHVIFNIS